MEELKAEIQQKLCETMQASIAHSSKSLRVKCAKDLPVHKLSKRSLFQASDAKPTTTSPNEAENLASDYDDMFPVIFNMWFWLMVVLALTVYAVSVGMWNMDPGRDSIIYRLTQ